MPGCDWLVVIRRKSCKGSLRFVLFEFNRINFVILFTSLYYVSVILITLTQMIFFITVN